MLTGQPLGQAIAEAIRLKGVTKTAVAAHFEVKGPSIYDWINHGRISKRHLTVLFDYFSDVVGPEHWGIESTPASQSERLNFDRIADATTEVFRWFQDHGEEFDPVADRPILKAAYEYFASNGAADVISLRAWMDSNRNSSGAANVGQRKAGRSGKDGVGASTGEKPKKRASARSK